MMNHAMHRFFVTCLGIAVFATGCDSLPLSFSVGGASELRILPDSVTLDVSEVGDEETNAAKARHDERCTGDPALDRTLRAGAVVIHAFHRLADRALALGARIRLDLTDPEQSQVSGTFFVFGQAVSYKADFSPFDFDGDGTADGSGTPGQTPVALRIWVDRGNGFERFLAALVTARPTASEGGAGELYVKPAAAHSDLNDDLALYVAWNRTDPSHRWNEAFVTGHVRPDTVLTMGHHRVDVRTDAAGLVEKTIRSTTVFSNHPLGFENYQFAAHFRRGAPKVLLSGLSTGGTIQVNFSNVCVDLATCTVDTGGGCDDFDVQDMDFLSAPTGSETAFPADFPDDPTF